MRIGLFGFCFRHENKGCEALTYAFVHMLSEIFVKDELTLCAFQVLDLGEFERVFTNIKFETCMLRLKRHPLQSIRRIRECDVLFDVTWGDGFSDIYYKEYAQRLILEKRLCVFFGRELILLPQTYGPFIDKSIEKKAMKVIKDSFRVYSRDQLSADYIKSKNGIDVPVYTDMAMYLSYKRDFPITDKTRIGFNVSGLLWNGGFQGKNQFGLKIDYHQYIETLIEFYLTDDSFEIHLIPHVIENVENALDGDVTICSELRDKYPTTILAPAFNTALDAKNYICNMDVFLGSRMHSTIAAFSSGVATIPVAYSRKFQGLYENLDYPYVVDATNIDSTEIAVEMTKKYIENRNDLKHAVDKSMNTVNDRLDQLKLVIRKDVGRD